nr:DIE2/ALG10 family [Tanacetum cinerariifolium]
MLYLEKLDEGCLYSKRLCILTTGKSNILETFKIIHKGKRFSVRAKETTGWIPDFDEQEEDNSESEDEQSIGFIKEGFDGSDVEKEGDNNVSMVPDSVKEDVNVQAEEKANRRGGDCQGEMECDKLLDISFCVRKKVNSSGDSPEPHIDRSNGPEETGNQSPETTFVVKQPTENKMAPKGSSEPHIGCSDGVVPPDTEEGTGIKSAEMKNVISEATHVVKKPGTTLPKTIIDFAVQCHTYPASGTKQKKNDKNRQ